MHTKLNFSSNILRLIAALALMSFLGACGSNSVDVMAKFSNTKDIKEGTTVYFEDRAVGEVEDVSGQDGGSIILLGINQDAATKISGHAAVVVNRIKPGAPLEIYNPSGDLRGPLEEGQMLQGMDSMLELMAWSVGDAINEGSKEFGSLMSGFTEYLKGDDFQRGKQEFQEQMKEAGNAAGNALRSVEQDISEAITNMVAAEEEAAQMVERLGEELSPMVAELSRSGAELSAELEKFAQGLENAAPEEQETGKRFMESLIATLEKLNESMEQGLEEQDQP